MIKLSDLAYMDCEDEKVFYAGVFFIVVGVTFLSCQIWQVGAPVMVFAFFCIYTSASHGRDERRLAKRHDN